MTSVPTERIKKLFQNKFLKYFLCESDWQWQDKIIEAKDPITSFIIDGNSSIKGFNEIK